MTRQQAGDRAERRLDPTPRQTPLHLGQSQVRRPRDLVEENRRMLLEVGRATVFSHRVCRQRAVAAQPGTPTAGARRADAKPLCDVRAGQALLQRSNNATTKIHGQGGRHGSSSNTTGLITIR